tara:strand:+ start:154 stop:273 length:120 start_codon:yes stop_codon:yes gene_type:complete
METLERLDEIATLNYSKNFLLCSDIEKENVVIKLAEEIK